jgi:O-methyltransferase
MKNKQINKEDIKSAYEVIRKQSPWRHTSSDILHHRVLPHATLAPWLNDTDFLKIYEKIKEHTLVDVYRCYELWLLAKQTMRIEGVILEVGVWRGGTGAIIAEAIKSSSKKVFLADTFKGVVKAGVNDTAYMGGEHSDTSLDIVSSLISSLNFKNVELLEGIFPEETHHLINDKVAMLHCDVDVYSSSKDIVEWCIPRMVVGSMIVFDDYGFYGCEGVTTYCHELKMRDEFIFIHNLNGHAGFVKTS